MLALERQNIETRRQQLELSRLEAEQNHRYALTLLEAQERDRQDARRHDAINSRMGAWIVTLIIVAVTALVGVALWRDKDALVLDVIKVLAGALGGGGIGYAAGRGRSEGSKGSEETNP